VSEGIVLLVIAGAYLAGRVHQWVIDAQKAMDSGRHGRRSH
jgi:hypothetical protein